MNDSDRDTIQLVQRMQQGDEEAFSNLYDRFADRIYAYIRMRVSESHHAEDILQDVFVKVWQNCRGLALKDLRFSAWIYAIATNTVRDYYRKAYRRPHTTDLSAAEHVPDSSDATRLVQQGFAHETVVAAMHKLSESYRSIIELRYFQEFSVEETARIMKKSSISVRVLQHRAIKKLERICKNLYGPGTEKFI